MSYDPLWDAARKATDDVLGEGEYARRNHDNPGLPAEFRQRLKESWSTKCFYCDEEVLPGQDSRKASNAASHPECAFRSVAGSVAHVEGRCSCYIPGSTEGDPPGMTRRQAAQAAMDAFYRGPHRPTKFQYEA